jgi:hypothetical protein
VQALLYLTFLVPLLRLEGACYVCVLVCVVCGGGCHYSVPEVRRCLSLVPLLRQLCASVVILDLLGATPEARRGVLCVCLCV